MPALLQRHGRVAASFFDILGQSEVDATSALGFACSRSPALATALLELTTGASGPVDVVRLEQRTEAGKRTDIELEGERSRVVIEAKVGFDIPTRHQLKSYLTQLRPDGRSGQLATLTNARKTARRQVGDHLDGRRVAHISWRQVHDRAGAAARDARGNERFVLVELTTYLKGIMAAQDLQSNLVYVVSLGRGKVAGTSMDFIDVILEYGRYFHPAHGAKGFPRVAPNYLGFRFDGKLQRIHHVEHAAIYDMRVDQPAGLPDLRHESWWTATPAEPTRADHVLYTLGPAIIPSAEVRTGNLFRAARVWAAIDLLLTSATIAEAAELTHRRLEQP